ncbi:MAG TPA: endolytic transglycosylase MltG [Candidatus Saccharimonadales bacterium]
MQLQSNSSALKAHMPRGRKVWWYSAAGVLAFFCLLVIGTFWWYNHNLTPVDSDASAKLFRVEAGDTADSIGRRLVTEGLIRNDVVFKIVLRLEGKASTIKAGAYQLSAAENMHAIIAKLVSGKPNTVRLQLSPGITLKTAREQIIKAGFSAEAVDAALAKKYNHPLLKDKPAEASLEGYLFPDTYFVNLDESPETLVVRMFDTLYQKIQNGNLLPAFSAEGLNMHQAIILASVIEKEVGPSDRAHVAQVFLSRLRMEMPLGSDATFAYAAAQLGVAATPDLNSPYNTRLVTGLPPGPISNVSYSSLEGLGRPTATEDLYFVSGDDGINYFSKTLPEHEANTAKYCHLKCQL